MYHSSEGCLQTGSCCKSDPFSSGVLTFRDKHAESWSCIDGKTRGLSPHRRKELNSKIVGIQQQWASCFSSLSDLLCIRTLILDGDRESEGRSKYKNEQLPKRTGSSGRQSTKHSPTRHSKQLEPNPIPPNHNKPPTWPPQQRKTPPRESLHHPLNSH